MAVQLTNDQFKQMLTRLMVGRQEHAVGQAQVGGGESKPCTLGVDKTKRLNPLRIGYKSVRSKWFS